MSSNDKERSKTPTHTTIKIAAKDASQRAADGGADPGPGDMSAEPSEMPEPVNVPQPPTPSELVVKSVKTSDSRVIKTIQDPVSLPKSSKSSASTRLSGGPKASQASQPTSLKALSGARSSGKDDDMAPEVSGSQAKSHHSVSAGGPKSGSGGGTSGAAFEGSAKGIAESPGASAMGSGGGAGGSGRASASGVGSVKTAKTASMAGIAGGPSSQASHGSQASGAGAGQEHDEVEEGEGEVEVPSPSPGPSTAASGAPVSPDATGPTSGGVDSAPASSGGGSSKMSPKTSAISKGAGASHHKSHSSASSASSAASSAHGHGHGKKKKKVTKFRYHKRITVRTHGKTSPSTIMHKVNEKDHKAGITPSTIEDMDTEELMKRAGIKGTNKTHWRVRLRQTKRLTKDGKTVTQTKVAYRDSEGNKRVKTSMSPFCKTCGKKLEECKCEEK